MEVGSNESIRTIVIFGRCLDLNKLIDIVDLKHFPKINFESIELIDTLDLILEVGSNESTRTVDIFGIYLDLNKSINTVDLKHFSKIHFESIELIDTIDLIFKKHLGLN